MESVKLEFHIAPLGRNCKVTVNGQTVHRLQRFELHAAYDDVTTVYIEGIMSDGSEVEFNGRLLLDETPKGGD